MLDRRMSAARMPARRGIDALADVPNRQRRHGPSELVIRREHAVIPMPVPPRRRHEIGELTTVTIDEFTRLRRI
jgi:hypothetical protein